MYVQYSLGNTYIQIWLIFEISPTYIHTYEEDSIEGYCLHCRMLEWCPKGTIYLVMCIVVRSVEALGNSAAGTASLAIASYTFPDRVSTVLVISRKHFLSACALNLEKCFEKNDKLFFCTFRGSSKLSPVLV